MAGEKKTEKDGEDKPLTEQEQAELKLLQQYERACKDMAKAARKEYEKTGSAPEFQLAFSSDAVDLDKPLVLTVMISLDKVHPFFLVGLMERVKEMARDFYNNRAQARAARSKSKILKPGFGARVTAGLSKAGIIH